MMSPKPLLVAQCIFHAVLATSLDGNSWMTSLVGLAATGCFGGVSCPPKRKPTLTTTIKPREKRRMKTPKWLMTRNLLPRKSGDFRYVIRLAPALDNHGLRGQIDQHARAGEITK